MTSVNSFEDAIRNEGGSSRVALVGPAFSAYERLSADEREKLREFLAAIERDDFNEDAPLPMASSHMLRQLSDRTFLVYQKLSALHADDPARYRIITISPVGSQLWKMSQRAS